MVVGHLALSTRQQASPRRSASVAWCIARKRASWLSATAMLWAASKRLLKRSTKEGDWCTPWASASSRASAKGASSRAFCARPRAPCALGVGPCRAHPHVAPGDACERLFHACAVRLGGAQALLQRGTGAPGAAPRTPRSRRALAKIRGDCFGSVWSGDWPAGGHLGGFFAARAVLATACGGVASICRRMARASMVDTGTT